MDKTEKVIKGLEGEIEKAVYHGNYFNDCVPVSLLYNALKLLKDPDLVKIVRCADCMYWSAECAAEGDTSGHCRKRFGACENQQTDAWWFCADGEKVNE